jgi:hypothetical protein
MFPPVAPKKKKECGAGHGTVLKLMQKIAVCAEYEES